MEMVIFFAMSWPVLIALRPYLARTLWLILFLLLPGTALLTVLGASSRGGQLGLLLVIALIVIASRLNWRVVAGVVVVVVVGYSVLPDAQKDRFGTAGDDVTSQSRLTVWAQGIEVFEDHPLTGIGYRNWGAYGEAHLRVMSSELPQTALHNSTLQAFVELGILGGALFLALVVGTFVVNARTRRRFREQGPDSGWLRATALGLDLSLAGGFVAGQFMSVLYYPMFWLTFSLTAALSNMSRAGRIKRHPQRLGAARHQLRGRPTTVGRPQVVGDPR